jgi:NTE family protein
MNHRDLHRRLTRIRISSSVLLLGALLVGCGTPAIRNVPAPGAAWEPQSANRASPEVFIALTFSGGGTRAAALAYGVLEELAASGIRVGGKQRRLLDEVDVVSSVSGGSFTSAYLGLHGGESLERFREDVLYRDMDRGLWHVLLNPLRWGSARGDMAARYYDEKIFRGATLGDFRTDGPRIIINATDLVSGTHFLFLPEYFGAICSDLEAYPVAWAVTASSAVPGAFEPIVLENHTARCSRPTPKWIERVLTDRPASSPEAVIARNLASYYAGSPRKYVHLIDGGVAGNLGVRVPMMREAEFGSQDAMWRSLGLDRADHVLLVVVNAATTIPPELDRTPDAPSALQVLSDVSTLLVNQNSQLSMELMRQTFERWKRERPAGRSTSLRIAELTFHGLQDPDERSYFEAVPTSLALDKEQVDRLVEAGRRLLRENPQYRAFVETLSGTP